MRVFVLSGLWLISAVVLCSCGQVTDASVFDTGSSDTGSSGSSSNDWTASGSASSVKEGKYSFVTSRTSVSCSDGSSTSSAGSALQMQVEIDSGYMTIYQSAASASSAGEKAQSTGLRVISSTAATGPISSAGSFSLSSTALFEDPSYGYIRASYNWNGKFSGSSWSGDHEYTLYFEDLFFSCDYRSTFSGSLVY